MPTQGVQNKQIVSATALLDQREILEDVVDIHRDDELTDILNICGRYKPTAMGTYHNFVNEALYVLLDTTGATVTGSGTPTVNTRTTPATSGFVRNGALIIFPNRKVGIARNVVINSGTGDTFTVNSIDGTNLTHTAGQRLSAFSNVAGEKGTAPVNIRYGLIRYFNKLQIFREVNEITDVQNASKVEVKYKGVNNIVYKDLFEKAIKHRSDINAAMIGGVMSSFSWDDVAPAVTDPNGGGNIQTTGGLDWYVDLYGVKDTVASLGTVTLADMEDFNSQMVAVKANRNLWQITSNAVGTKIDNMVKALNSSGQIQSVRMMVDGKTVDFTTTSFTYGNFTYERLYLPILDHNELFSQTDIVKNAYYVPKDKVRVHGGGGYQPRMQVRYFKSQVANNLGNDIYEEWHDGALAPTGPVGGEKIWRTHFSSTQGLEILGAQHCARQRVLV